MKFKLAPAWINILGCASFLALPFLMRPGNFNEIHFNDFRTKIDLLVYILIIGFFYLNYYLLTFLQVNTFRMYNPDGSWFKEGHGVDPDIVVNEDLTALAKGADPQLQKAIETAQKLVKEKGYNMPPRPANEKR